MLLTERYGRAKWTALGPYEAASRPAVQRTCSVQIAVQHTSSSWWSGDVWHGGLDCQKRTKTAMCGVWLVESQMPWNKPQWQYGCICCAQYGSWMIMQYVCVCVCVHNTVKWGTWKYSLLYKDRCPCSSYFWSGCSEVTWLKGMEVQKSSLGLKGIILKCVTKCFSSYKV